MDDQPGGPGPIDLAILAYATALLVLWSPTLNLGLLTPRILVMLCALGPGLVVVARLALDGDRGARWASGFLGWTLLATALAPQAWKALAGTYGTDVGWIYLVGYLSAWGLGRRLSPRGRALLPAVLLTGIAVNAMFGVLEAALDPVGDLATEAGRVHGLVTNSLFLGGLLVGGLGALGYLAGSRPRRLPIVLATTVLVVMAVNLTGSRVALVGGAVVVAAAAFVAAVGTGAPRRAALRPVLFVAAAVVVGFGLSVPFQGAESGSARLGETAASSGYESRTLMWRAGFEAVAERPVVGWGPGRFGEATAPRTTAAFVRAEGPDKLFYDAHNLFVEHLVTSGIVGLGLLLGFGWCAVRRARGPLAWLGAGIALTWLLNPVSITTGTIALLALGAAWREAPRPDETIGDEAMGAAEGADEADGVDEVVVAAAPRVRPGHVIGALAGLAGLVAGLVVVRADAVVVADARRVRPGHVIGALAGLAGLVAGLVVVRADAHLDTGVATGDVAAVQAASDLLPWDSVITGILAEAHVREAGEDPTPEQARTVMDATRRAVRQDPTRAYWWVRLGFREFDFGTGSEEERLERSKAAFEEALRRSPWSAAALFGLQGVARQQDDQAEVDRLTDVLCEIDICAPD